MLFYIKLFEENNYFEVKINNKKAKYTNNNELEFLTHQKECIQKTLGYNLEFLL